MWLIDCPDTSVRNCRSSLRNILQNTANLTSRLLYKKKSVNDVKLIYPSLLRKTIKKHIHVVGGGGQNVEMFKVKIRVTYRNQELLNNENIKNTGDREDSSAFLETPTYDIKLWKDRCYSKKKRAVSLFYTYSTLVLHLYLIPKSFFRFVTRTQIIFSRIHSRVV
jgi:hypothetical protein